MPYELKHSKQCIKFLNKHPHIKQRVLESLRLIALDPYNAPLDIKKLAGTSNRYRLRISKYRVLYEVRESEILIYAYRAEVRGDVYK